MIQVFRAVGTKIAAGIFVVLMLVFVLTSVDWGQLSTGGAVGKINGRRIDARVYQTAVQRATDARQQQSPNALTLDDYAAIRDQVWEQFVQGTVLEAEYKRHGITVSDDEIVNALRNSPPSEFLNIPDFQTDSQFDLGKYQRWLTSSVAQPYLPGLEAQYRDEIRQAKLFQIITADVFLSDAALWQRYRDQQETVKIGLTAIVPRTAVPDSAVTVAPSEVEAYYRAHPKEFERPRTAYLSYVTVPRLTNATDSALARARIDSLRQEILGGSPFAEVAKRESADSVSGAQGGDLGEWTRGRMDPAFDSAAFALPLNKVSTPVLSRFGLHLIEVTSRKGDKVKARHILVPIEVAGAHRNALDARADSLDELGAEQTEAAALDRAAKALGLTIGRTGPVAEGSRVQIDNVPVPDAGSWAFEGQPNATSPVIEAPWAYYLFRLDSIQAAGVPPLAQVRPLVEDIVRQQKKREATRKVAESYLQRLAQGVSMTDAAKVMNLPYHEFGPFTRINPPVADPVLIGAAFGLEAGQRSGLVELKDGVYVIQALERTKADSAKFVEASKELRARAMGEVRQERVRLYLDALRESAKIVDRRSELQQQQAPQQPT